MAAIIDRAKASGARFIYPSFGLTMRDGQREHLYSQLDSRFPGIREKYERRFGMRYNCSSPRARQLYGFFTERCNRLGILHSMRDIIASYKMGYEAPQLSLFEI